MHSIHHIANLCLLSKYNALYGRMRKYLKFENESPYMTVSIHIELRPGARNIVVYLSQNGMNSG